MLPTKNFRSETTRRKRFLMAAACLATLATANPPMMTKLSAEAPQCGCSDGCDGGCGIGQGPIYKTLDTVAGGIEKLLFFSLKHHRGGCDDMACDDGCDAMTMGDMMNYEDTHVPMRMAPPVLMAPSAPQPAMSHPGHAHVAPSLPPQSLPNRVMQSVPGSRTVPQAPVQMTHPRLAPVQQPAVRMSQPTPLPNGEGRATGSGLMPPERNNDDSLFDNLQDPFRDDSAQLNAPRSGSPGAIETRPASYRTSSRRVITSR